jgi:hypothetical protein
VRGFTRDVKGKKHFIDHKINSVQDYLAKHIRQKYEMFDVNVYQENIFHTKMHIKDFDLDTYLFEARTPTICRSRSASASSRCCDARSRNSSTAAT